MRLELLLEVVAIVFNFTKSFTGCIVLIKS